MQPPNIIFIITDQQRYDTIRALGPNSATPLACGPVSSAARVTQELPLAYGTDDFHTDWDIIDVFGEHAAGGRDLDGAADVADLDFILSAAANDVQFMAAEHGALLHADGQLELPPASGGDAERQRFARLGDGRRHRPGRRAKHGATGDILGQRREDAFDELRPFIDLPRQAAV